MRSRHAEVSARDSNRSKSKLPAISPALADRICRGLLPLAENAWTLSGRLAAAGFGAHVPWQQFFESFAADDAELQEFRSYRIELAKNVVGRPWPMSVVDRSVAYFSSEQVAALFARRDRDNGVDESQLAARYPRGESVWRLELTRCDRRRVQLEMQQRDEYERLRTRTEQESERVLRTEIKGSDGDAHFGDNVACYESAMELHATKLGFHRDDAKSTGPIPIFSKEIAAGWDLCWAIEQTQVFVGRPQSALFNPDLQLRSRFLAGPVDRAPHDRYLAIRYGQVVPEFLRGYQRFSDFASLETLVRAHLAVYELMAAGIEGAIRKQLAH